MSVTVYQIARAAGLSQPTVSEILNGKGDRYRLATRERVLAVARELGYRRNAYARGMATGRFDAVALLVSTEIGRSGPYLRVLEGAHDALAERGMHVSLARLPDQALCDEGYVPNLLREWRVDGLLITYATQIPARMSELIAACGLPSVWLNSKRAVDCVHPDDVHGGRIATEHLLGLGHRRIAYVDFTRGERDREGAHYSEDDRLAGYQEAMRSAGLAPWIVRGERRIPSAERLAAARALLMRTPRPTAVVTYGWAPGEALFAAALGAGLRVPQDLSLVAIENAIPNESAIAVTTALVPEHAMGRDAVPMLLARLADPCTPVPALALPYTLSVQRSCAPPSA